MHNRHSSLPDRSTLHALAESDCHLPEAIDAAALAGFRRECDAPGANLSDELLQIYLNELQPRISAIREAIERADAPALTFAAHALKGSSTLIGALPLAELCLQLEQAGRSDTLALARPLLTRLEQEALRVRLALACAEHGTGQ